MLDELARLQTLMQESQAEPAVETMTKKLNYLKQRRAMLAYATFQAQGSPIGSGSVESANKVGVQSRMKGAGMRWGDEHVNLMLAMRNLAWNDRWDQGWSAIRKLWQQERQAKRRQRATLSSPQTPGQSSAPAAPMDQTRSSERPKKHSSALPTAQQQTPPAAAVPTGSQRSRPAATHPWRQPFLRRRLA